jgi:hypothetical protein
VIDDFISPDCLERVRDEAVAVDRSQSYIKFLDSKTDHKKSAFTPDIVGPETSRLVNFLNSGVFVGYLEKLTSISGLLPDPSYFGGGLHIVEPGGYLEIHADFNHLKRYNLERRLNLLLYLNKDWASSYNGDFELWDRPTMSRVTTVAPLFNRCVIFSTTAESLHGHPAPLASPPHLDRMSIALYYYTNTWNPAVGAHSTLYHISQNNKVRFRPDRVIGHFLLDFIPPIFVKPVRALVRRARGEKLTDF